MAGMAGCGEPGREQGTAKCIPRGVSLVFPIAV